MYKVEKILDKKKDKRKILYLVKWEGFQIQQATWQPKKNLQCLQQMIQEYENEKQNQNDRKSKKSKESLNSNQIIEENENLEVEKEKEQKVRKKSGRKYRKQKQKKYQKSSSDNDKLSISEEKKFNQQVKQKSQQKKQEISVTQERIIIVGMKKEKQIYKYYVVIEGKGEWVLRKFLIKNYPEQLCQFYEKRIIFQEQN